MKQLYPGNHDNLSGGGAAVRADTHPQMESIYIYTHLTMEASVHVTWLLLPDWSSALCWPSVATSAPPEPRTSSRWGRPPLLEWRELPSAVQDDRAQPVLLAGADGGDGAVVELEGRPPVHHHAGVPAAGAHTQPVAAETGSHTHTHTEENRIQVNRQQLTGDVLSLISAFLPYNCHCTKKAHFIDRKKVLFFHFRCFCRS